MEKFRKKGPAIKRIGSIEFPAFESTILDNELPVYSLSSGTQDIIKLEIVFQSGRPFEVKKVASRACNSQLKEGCATYDSQSLADRIDYYGATLRTMENLDTCSIVLFCLGKHFENLVPIIKDMITSPLFPEDELRKYVNNNSERLKVELTKNDVIAYRSITEQIFTQSHPYGYNSEISDYKALERKDLVHHYDKNYGHNNCMIFLSGKIDSSHIKICNQYFGHDLRKSKPEERVPKIIGTNAQYIHIKTDQDFQTAVKIGTRLFKRSHPDYPGMYFLNSVLGGYFGSRLMSNIREDKGYTYNIYSEVDVMKHDGLFMIGTEVSNEHLDSTLSEINKEITKLKRDLIPGSELQMVRNYLLGRILNFIDGPFNSARLLKSIIQSDLDKDYFKNLIDTITKISAHELRDLANKYFEEDKLWKITVGK